MSDYGVFSSANDETTNVVLYFYGTDALALVEFIDEHASMKDESVSHIVHGLMLAYPPSEMAE
eukprot:3232818-Ditylum_brightwellii.AAC.1